MTRNGRAELVWCYGTMDCGKSTLALQNDFNYSNAGRRGLLFTMHDRAGAAISSRIGLARPAAVIDAGFDFVTAVEEHRLRRGRLDYLICDEAQFYSPAQVDQLALIVDELGVDVEAFGIATDFQSRLFPGSQRLFELADRRVELQVAALCWCGAAGNQNARVVDGKVVREGSTVLVGDTVHGDAAPAEIHYELLCRRHWRLGVTWTHAAQQGLFPL
ncbi:thymidine kinase [soil metagenome]